MNKIFKVYSLGCKVNQYESRWLSSELKKMGFVEAKDNYADIYLINTCTVTQKAAMQSRQLVRQCIRNNSKSNVIVTGCHVQNAPNEFEKIKGADFIFGNAFKHFIPQYIAENIIFKSNKIFKYADILNYYKFEHMPFTDFNNKTRFFFKIQDGCNAFCSYCIVPYTRGPSRSLECDKILEHIKNIIDSGYKEIVFSGINLGCYGRDLKPATNLYNLLRKVISTTNGSIRIRLSSIEPALLTNELIQLIAQCPDLCNHFHIPLQSGDDKILKKMNRHYSIKFFKDLIINIKQKIPEAAIGIDILSGMPGETDSAFSNTYKLIEELPVTYLHVFPFSPRKDTPAFSYKNIIKSSVIKERCKKLRLLGTQKRIDFYKQNIGKNLKVLIESTRDKKTNLLKGFSSNYVPVYIDGESKLMNSICDIHTIKCKNDDGIIGKIN